VKDDDRQNGRLLLKNPGRKMARIFCLKMSPLLFTRVEISFALESGAARGQLAL